MSLRVLFVDDEQMILDGLKMVLRKQRREWHMVFAQGGEEALGILDVEPFDVLVTDLKMPKIDGNILLSIAEERYPKMARIMLSGGEREKVFNIAATKAHASLRKPCNPVELKETISRLCRGD